MSQKETLKHSAQNKNNHLSKLDLFGIQPKIYFENKESYQTKFGSLMSVFLFACVCIAIWVYGKEMYYKENPNTTFTEKINKHPSRYDLNETNFNFAFGLQGSDWAHYLNESIYTVQLTQKIQRKIKHDNGTITKETVKKDLESRQCQPEDFKVDKEFFMQQSYDQLYCIQNYEDLFIEGDYGQDVYSTLIGQVKSCDPETSTVQCESEKEITSQLNDNFWAFYFVDQIVDPKNYTDPFQPTGRSIYGYASRDTYKSVTINFRNVIMEDNTGVVFDKKSEKRGLSFSYNQEMGKVKEPKAGSKFLQFVIRMEKVKETKIYRTYLNAAEVIANVGGILKVLMMFFMVTSILISRQIFNLKLINDLFQFEEDSDSQNTDKNKKTNPNNNNDNNNSDKSKKKRKHKKGSLVFKSMFNFFPFCQKKEVVEKKKLYNFALNKMSNHLNVNYILNKLLEIEKLKMLIMDDEQYKLFNLIQKPTISHHLVEEQTNPQSQLDSKKPNTEFSVNITDIEKNKKPQLQQNTHVKFSNLLLQRPQTKDEIIVDAVSAFKTIKKRQSKSAIENKILELIDQNTLSQLERRMDRKSLKAINVTFQQEKEDSQEENQTIQEIQEISQDQRCVSQDAFTIGNVKSDDKLTQYNQGYQDKSNNSFRNLKQDQESPMQYQQYQQSQSQLQSQQQSYQSQRLKQQEMISEEPSYDDSSSRVSDIEEVQQTFQQFQTQHSIGIGKHLPQEHDFDREMSRNSTVSQKNSQIFPSFQKFDSTTLIRQQM